MPIMRITQAIVLLSFMITTVGSTVSPSTSCPTASALCVFRNSSTFGSTVIVTEQSTYYSVYSNSIPDHAYLTGINPSVSAQSNMLRIPKTVTRANAAQQTLGTLGVMFNGVSVYSSSDARTFTGCSGNAGVLELVSLDTYGGHPDPKGNYHYHVAFFLRSAAALQLSHTPTAHSSLLGWAADGLPIYGPYGYVSNSSKSITLLKSCYFLKTARTCCTDNSQCGTTVKQGPQTLSLGSFNEDYEFNATAYIAGDCHLDEFNTRIAATPEFSTPTTRFYVFTLNSDNTASYPYIIHGTKGLYGQMMGNGNNGGTTGQVGGTTATGQMSTTTGQVGATQAGGMASTPMNEAVPSASSPSPAVLGVAIGVSVGGAGLLLIIGAVIYFYKRASMVRGVATHIYPHVKAVPIEVTAPASYPMGDVV